MSRPRRGSQAVEMALVFPVLLAIVSGVLDYGWLALHEHLAADAAAVGARAGASAVEGEDPIVVATEASTERWRELGLSARPEIEARIGGGRIEVELTFGDLRPVGLVPGPNTLSAVRSRTVEEEA